MGEREAGSNRQYATCRSRAGQRGRASEPGLCFVCGLPYGGLYEGQKRACVPKMGFSFLALYSISFSPGAGGGGLRGP